MANVATEQFDALTAEGRVRLGTPIGFSEKIHVQLAAPPSDPLPLAALYLIWRGADVDEVTFELVDPPDPRQLLGATFMPHVITPERLMTQLHTCAEIAATVPAYVLMASWQHSAPEIADAVERHFGALA
jgi:hypothetical protein